LGLKKAAKTWFPPFSSLSRVRRPTDFEGKTGKLIHQVSIWCLYLGHRSGYSSHFRPPATHQKGIADVERRIMLEPSRPADVSLPRNGATPNLRKKKNHRETMLEQDFGADPIFRQPHIRNIS
jgi:hypothetical protein